MQQLVIKQYSFLQVTDKFYSDNENSWIKKNKDFTKYADESTFAAKKKMLVVFIGTYDGEENNVGIP